jgi:hypothetical protein
VLRERDRERQRRRDERRQHAELLDLALRALASDERGRNP